MGDKELEKEIEDEKTGISYTLVEDYYLPNYVDGIYFAILRSRWLIHC